MFINWTLGLLYILGGTHAMNFEKICIASHLPFPGKVSFVPVQLHLGRILVCIRELKEQQRLRQRKLHLKTNIWANMTILRLFLLACACIVGKARYKWTGRSAVEVNLENQRCTVECSRCR